MYLSIILPYYKKKKFIKETLNSIINQSLKYELIIIYDQKNLDDLDYIKILKKIKHRIIINNKNLGVVRSRNIGIKNQNLSYYFFVMLMMYGIKRKLKYN